jgi:3-dehydroquinate synthase
MQTIAADNYSIYFDKNGYNRLNEFLVQNKYSSLFILVDENTNEFCLPLFLPQIETNLTIEIIEIEVGESLKTISTCIELWEILTELGADRKSLIINLGGGVITDIGGFVASTFKRGIDFIHVPTTLLGMVDASIGGKNGVDLGKLKNQIGVINVPKLILIDTSFLKTLPENEKCSGIAEMMKHGLIYNYNYWTHFRKLNSSQVDYLHQLIHRSIEIKNEIVMQDLTENGIRKALNFGHTLGHAIESYFLESETPLLHGEAIAVGMILESYISKEKNLITTDEYLEIKTSISSVFDKVKFTKEAIEGIKNLLIHDKKNEYGKVQFSLLDGIGKCKINQEVDNQLIFNSFEDYKI